MPPDRAIFPGEMALENGAVVAHFEVEIWALSERTTAPMLFIPGKLTAYGKRLKLMRRTGHSWTKSQG